MEDKEAIGAVDQKHETTGASAGKYTERSETTVGGTDRRDS